MRQAEAVQAKAAAEAARAAAAAKAKAQAQAQALATATAAREAARIQSMLAAEPAAGPEVTAVRVQMPGGRIQRRFHKSTPLASVRLWVEGHLGVEQQGARGGRFELVSPMPGARFVASCANEDATLEQAGLHPGVAFNFDSKADDDDCAPSGPSVDGAPPMPGAALPAAPPASSGKGKPPAAAVEAWRRVDGPGMGAPLLDGDSDDDL